MMWWRAIVALLAIGNAVGDQQVVPLVAVNDMFLAGMSIGTPAQSVLVELDTGSTHSWVPAVGVPSYNPTLSSSYAATGVPFDVHYADGTGSFGVTGDDVATLGDMANTTSARVRLGIVDRTSVRASDADGRMYGVMGLSPASPAAMTFLAATNGTMITFDVSKGVVMITGDATDRDMVWVPTIPSPTPSWEILTDSIQFGGTVHRAAHALIDTGCTWIRIPSRQARPIFRLLNADDNGFISNCQSRDSWPVLNVVVQGKIVAIGWRHWTMIEDNQQGCVVKFRAHDSHMWTLGVPFLSAARVTFRYLPAGNATVGITFHSVQS
ncbi:unnamed protein product (mitochondrion) [Plasmodiophora brassicae]|uniref:Peptidase A1 domain-containing protein n=2 Tax=Plasmodiophora brassicae TaxID=37360 RepID=A0A3P3YLY1_PLABS|nr:unnamed protein product [Plasmodiophora brassicae]